MSSSAPRRLTQEHAAQLGTILRIIGAVFILGGGVIGLDIGGIATKVGLNDGSDASIHPLFGGMFILVGLVDIFVFPVFFKRLADKHAASS